MNLELKKAIDQISKDKGIDREMLIDTLEEAIRASVTKKYGDKMDIEVTFNEETGEIEVYQFKIVVEEVEGNPGYYTSKFFLRPHYQLEGLSVSLRLVSKLPSEKG